MMLKSVIRQTLTLLALFFGVAINCFAQEYTVSPEPNWVKPIAAAERSSPNNTHSGGIEYLLADYQSKYQEGQLSSYRHFSTRALNTTGVGDIAQFSVDFDPIYESIQLHKIDVIRDGKRINMLDRTRVSVFRTEKNREYQIYDGSKTLNVIIEDVAIGDTVEYSYTKNGLNPVFNGHLSMTNRLQWTVPVGKLHYRLLTPSTHPLYFKNIETNIKSTKRNILNNTEYTWLLNDVPAIIVEDDSPQWYEPYGKVYISDIADWQGVVDWALPMYQSVTDTPAQMAIVNNIVATKKNKEERILAALEYVQNQIRYLGIEMGARSHKPNEPDKVISQRYGDCKDKARLLVSMLNSMGIQGESVFVNTDNGDTVNKLLPTPVAFNHAIVRVKLDGKTYWLDPTRNYQSGNLNSIYQPDYGYALVLSKKDGGLINMADSIKTVHTKISTEEFNLRKAVDGNAEYQVETVYGQYYADKTRRQLAEKSRTEIQKTYLDYMRNYYQDITLDSDFLVNDDSVSNKLTIFEKYSIPNIWEPDDKNGLVYSEFYPFLIVDHVNKPDSPIRKDPYHVTHPVNYKHVTTIKLPKGFTISNATERVDDKAFEFSKKVSFAKDTLKVEYEYKSLSDSVEPARFTQYAKNIGKVNGLANYSLQMLNPAIKTSDYFTNLDDMNWTMLFGAIIAAALSFFLVAKYVYAYDKPYVEKGEIDQNLNGIGGWLLLPVIGLFLTPFKIIVGLDEFLYAFSLSQWSVVIVNYDQTTMFLYFIFSIFINIMLIFMAIGLLIILFQKRHTFPKLYILFLAGHVLALVLLDHILAPLLLGDDFETTTEEYKDLGRAFAGAFIWIMYIKASVRVNSTFTRQRNEKKEKVVIAAQAS